MSSVAEKLRQTSKGKLVYDRKFEEKQFRDFLSQTHSISTSVLPTVWTEISPGCDTIGLGPSGSENAEGKQTISQGLKASRRQWQDADSGSEQGEKGERDSKEKELCPSSVGCNNVSDIWHNGCKQPVVHKRRSLLSERDGKECPVNNRKKSQDSSTSSDLSKPDDKEGELEVEDFVDKKLTVSFTEKLRMVQDLETDWDNTAKELKEKKQQEFLKHEVHLSKKHDQDVSQVQQKYQKQLEHQRDLLERNLLARKQETKQAVQKVKETHHKCTQRQDARLKAMEQLDQKLKDEKVKREQAKEQKLGELRAVAQNIEVTKTTLTSTLDNCPHKQYLNENAEKLKLLVNKLSEQAEMWVNKVDPSVSLEEVMSKLKHMQEQSQNALDFVNTLTAEAEQKARATAAAEAERQKALAQSPQQPQVQGASQSVAWGEAMAADDVRREYENSRRHLSETEAALQSFISSQQMKAVRFDLQKAVNIPVNAISPVSSSHLRDKLQRLRALLKGETVEVSGKLVSAQTVPEGILFCKNLLAKMLVRKADEQVSSNHESAFAIAAVAVGLWAEFPDVGVLLMAHLQTMCPYVLPYYPPRLPDQSSTDYHKVLGYKILDDGTIEEQDKFLRRMSGIMRLYAAILVTAPPQGVQYPHPHGVEYAWIWLTRTANLKSYPDITATIMYDLLQVAGNFMLRAYRVQFAKLLYCLSRKCLPMLKEVAVASGPVTRLQIFLETALKNNAFIPEPEGFLPPSFWNS